MTGGEGINNQVRSGVSWENYLRCEVVRLELLNYFYELPDLFPKSSPVTRWANFAGSISYKF
jgi:hypothetical protein